MTDNTTPAGYRRNAQGNLVPEENVREIDKLRDDLVREIVADAEAVHLALATFKTKAMADIAAFVDLSAERYNVKLGGRKGNLTLSSYDGAHKVQFAIADRIVFDEGIQAAKALVDECIHRWTEGSRSEIKALVEHAFQVDKEGNINLGRVLTLTRLQINDPTWQTAMQAIRDSMTVASSRSYVRIYRRRGQSELYDQVPLDLAKVAL